MDMWWLWSIGGVVLAAIGAIAVKRSSVSTPAISSDPDQGAKPAPKSPGAPGAASPPPSPPPVAAPAPPVAPKPQPAPDVNGGHPYEVKVANGIYQFWTPVEYAIEGSPRVDTPFGGKVTAAPLKDSRTGGYARLRYRDALTWAQKNGGMLLSESEQDQLSKVGIMLPPLPLPGSSKALLSKGYQAGGPQMSSLEWAQVEDALIDKALVDRGWDGQTIVNNAGKDWIRGAKPGRAINRGWYDKSAKYGMIQTTGGAHDDGHTDYSQLTRVVWPA